MSNARNPKSIGNYMEHLDSMAPPFESEEWIIGGKERTVYAAKGMYGKALYKHDRIAFNVGFNEWKMDNFGSL